MSIKTMDILFLAVLLATWVGFIILVYGLATVPELFALRRMAKCERNRNRFGELRTRLMRLARAGKTDVNGPYFQFMYRVITALMRDPHQYANTAQSILNASFAPGVQKKGDGSTFNMTHAESRLMIAFAHGLDKLCRDYSKPYRWLARLAEAERKHREARSLRPLHGLDYAPLWLQHSLGHAPSFRRIRPVLLAKTKLIELGRGLRAQVA